MKSRHARTAVVAGATAGGLLAGWTAVSAFLMPLPVWDPAQIGQQATTLGKIRTTLQMTRGVVGYVYGITRIVDGGVLGILSAMDLPGGWVTKSALRYAKTGQVPYRMLASKAMNMDGLSDEARTAMKTAWRVANERNLNPATAMYHLGKSGALDDMNPVVRDVTDRLRDGNISGKEGARILMRNAPEEWGSFTAGQKRAIYRVADGKPLTNRHYINLVPREQRKLAGIALDERERQRAIIDAGVEVAKEARARAWDLPDDEMPAWATTLVSASASEPARATLGAMSNRIHPRILKKMPYYDQLKSSAYSPPGTESLVSKAKIGLDIAKWGKEKMDERSQNSIEGGASADDGFMNPGHPNAPADAREEERDGWDQSVDKAQWAMDIGEQSGIFDFLAGDMGWMGLAQGVMGVAGPGMEDQGAGILGVMQESNTLLKEVLKTDLLPNREARNNVRFVRRGLRGMPRPPRRTRHGRVQERSERAVRVLPVGEAARVRMRCEDMNEAVMDEENAEYGEVCRWEEGSSVPGRAEPSAIEASGQHQDGIILAMEQQRRSEAKGRAGEEAPELPEDQIESMSADAEEMVAAAELGCPWDAGGVERIEGAAPPISRSGESTMLDGLYLEHNVAGSRDERRVQAVKEGREVLLAIAALTAWANATVRPEESLGRRLEAKEMMQRIEECDALACDWRMVADASRIEGGEAVSQAHMALAALRLEMARAVSGYNVWRE